MFGEAAALLCDLPVLALCAPSSAADASATAPSTSLSSTDLDDALRPMTDYVRQVFVASRSLAPRRATAIQILLALALARGSLVDLLVLVRQLVRGDAQYVAPFVCSWVGKRQHVSDLVVS